MDYKVTINRLIVTHHYPLPRLDDLFAKLTNCKWFCALDLVGAYQQLTVSERSQELLTINTHKRLYRYQTFCFGAACAPSIFQSVMDQILLNIGQIFCYLDDILIGAATREECEQKLNVVLSKLTEYNIRINVEKCKFFQIEIEFLGHVITSEGIKPNVGKVRAILEAPHPENLRQLQSYLGLLNYYAKFISNLSSELQVLYKLLRKETLFKWTPECQEVFEQSKKFLVNHNVLEIYDLSHLVNGQKKPVLYASSTLSPAEKTYSQLYREALAIIFALKVFHKYIYGIKFQLYTDAEALKEIFSPEKGTSLVACSKMQRWAVTLSMYDYELKYKPTSKMVNVDALSRLPITQLSNMESDKINSLDVKDNDIVTPDKVSEAVKNDKILKEVYKYVKEGWVKNKAIKSDSILNYYYKLRVDLSIEQECIYFRNRIVIPERFREQVLRNIHKNHDGIVRTKMLARGIVWWKGMDKDIENMIKACEICNCTSRVPKEKVESMWPEAKSSFERIHVDLFHFRNDSYLILVEAYSKFIEVKLK